MSDNQCFECNSSDNLHDHHVVPQSRGGTQTVKLCKSCHKKAHGSSGNWDVSSLTSEAIQNKKERNEYTGGKTPFGYRVAEDGKHIVEDPEEQRIIQKALSYRDAGLSLRDTADKLDERGMYNRNKNKFAAVTISLIEKRAKQDDPIKAPQ